MRPYHTLPIDANTLAYWRPGERLSWLDQSGHGVDLTPVNGATLSPDGMEVARASSQYATVTDDGLNLRAIGATEVTLECWFRLASLPGDAEDWGLCCQSTTTHISIARSGATYSLKGRFKEYLANDLWLSHDFTPVVGQLYAVRLTWKRTVGAWLYLDGAQVDENLATNGSGPATNSGLFRVGMLTGGGTYFNGLIDEVCLSRTLRCTTDYVPRRFTEGRRLVPRGPGLAWTPGLVA